MALLLYYDPNNEIIDLVEALEINEVPIWDHKWSGHPRQSEVFDIVTNLQGEPSATKLTFIDEISEKTTPKSIDQNNHVIYNSSTDPESISLDEIFNLSNEGNH